MKSKEEMEKEKKIKAMVFSLAIRESMRVVRGERDWRKLLGLFDEENERSEDNSEDEKHE